LYKDGTILTSLKFEESNNQKNTGDCYLEIMKIASKLFWNRV